MHEYISAFNTHFLKCTYNLNLHGSQGSSILKYPHGVHVCIYIYIYIYIYIIIIINPSRQPSRLLYSWGVRRRGKIGKQGKVGVKRKWWVLAQPPYSPQGNGRFTWDGTMEPGEQTPCCGEPRELVLSKAGTGCETVGTFQIHSHKTNTSTGKRR